MARLNNVSSTDISDTNEFRLHRANFARTERMVGFSLLGIAALGCLPMLIGHGGDSNLTQYWWVIAGLIGLWCLFGTTDLRAVHLRIGAEGVSLPKQLIGPIPWTLVKRVEAFSSTRHFPHASRDVSVPGMRFTFAHDALRRRQFMSKSQDVWEVITEIDGQRPRKTSPDLLDAPTDEIIAKIECYTSVEKEPVCRNAAN